MFLAWRVRGSHRKMGIKAYGVWDKGVSGSWSVLRFGVSAVRGEESEMLIACLGRVDEPPWRRGWPRNEELRA